MKIKLLILSLVLFLCGAKGSRSAAGPINKIQNAAIFRQYDSLEAEATKMKEAQEAMDKSKGDLESERTKRTNVQEELEEIKEKYRLDKKDLKRTKSHWFFGTTILQPQLWFSGGCSGKIERLKSDLQHCKSVVYPDLEEKLHKHQEIVRRLEEQYDERIETFERCQKASKTQTELMNKATLGSPELLCLNSDYTAKQKQLDHTLERLETIKEASALQKEAEHHVFQTKYHLNRALEYRKEYRERELKYMVRYVFACDLKEGKEYEGLRDAINDNQEGCTKKLEEAKSEAYQAIDKFRQVQLYLLTLKDTDSSAFASFLKPPLSFQEDDIEDTLEHISGGEIEEQRFQVQEVHRTTKLLISKLQDEIAELAEQIACEKRRYFMKLRAEVS